MSGQRPTDPREILCAADRERDAAKALQKCVDELLAVPSGCQPDLHVKVRGFDTKIDLRTYISHVNIPAIIADHYAIQVARHVAEADRLEALVTVSAS